MTGFIRIVSVLAFLFAVAFPALAQNEPAEFIQIVTTTVKPDRGAEYESWEQKIRLIGPDLLRLAPTPRR